MRRPLSLLAEVDPYSQSFQDRYDPAKGHLLAQWVVAHRSRYALNTPNYAPLRRIARPKEFDAPG